LYQAVLLSSRFCKAKALLTSSHNCLAQKKPALAGFFIA